MTPEILLHDVTDSDLPIFFEQQLDPEATAMADFPSRDHESFMLHWKKIMANETGIIKTILFDGQVAGYILSWEMLGHWEVGYWLGRKLWGMGIASEALRQFLGVVTSRPLFAHVVIHNTASKRVLEKCGFLVVREDSFLDKNGREIKEFVLQLNGHGNK